MKYHEFVKVKLCHCTFNQVALAEWLRRVPAKYMGFPRESSNLSGDDSFTLFFWTKLLNYPSFNTHLQTWASFNLGLRAWETISPLLFLFLFGFFFFKKNMAFWSFNTKIWSQLSYDIFMKEKVKMWKKKFHNLNFLKIYIKPRKDIFINIYKYIYILL